MDGLREAWMHQFEFPGVKSTSQLKIQFWNSVERLDWICTVVVISIQLVPESWERRKSSIVWGTKGKKYEMPTFLWLQKEEPRGYPERRVREGRKKAGEGNILKAQGRKNSPFPQRTCLLPGFPMAASGSPSTQLLKEANSYLSDLLLRHPPISKSYHFKS